MDDDVDRFIGNLLDDLKHNRLQLPTLPQVALKVSDSLDDPNVTARELAKLISTDAALTARLIQVANSPLYRGSARIDNVQAAVSRLGLRAVRNLVTTLLMKQLFNTRYPALKQRMEALWLHSTHVAAMSYVLADKYTLLNADEAMLGGLVHDIGVLPILGHAQKYPTIADNSQLLEQIIERVSPVLGRTMLQAWRFPPALVNVAAEHHNLQRDHAGDADYTDVIIVAILHSHLGTDHPLASVNWSEVPAFEKLGLTPRESMNTLQKAREEILAIWRLLS